MEKFYDFDKIINKILAKKHGNETEEYKKEYDKYFNEIEYLEGECLKELPCNYTVIDVETTGLNSYDDDIIEISCIKYRNDVEIDRYHSLINPCGKLAPFITGLTGITDEMLFDAPKFKDIADEIYDFLKDEVLVGHNVNFDISFLRESFFSNDKFYDYKDNVVTVMSNDYIDMLRISRKLFPDFSSRSLIDMASYFDIVEHTHRSTDDCITVYNLFLCLKKYMKEHGIDYTELMKSKKNYYKTRPKVDLRTLISENTEIDENNPFFEKNVVFTGTLIEFPRVDAAQIVVNLGGHCQNGVNKMTDILIVGGFESSNIKDGKSTKLKKVEKINFNGGEIQVIDELTFYMLLRDWLK